MHNAGQIAIPALIVIFILYRRISKSIGFQQYRPNRMKLRIGIFGLIGIILLAAGFVHPILFAADAAGIALGAALAYLAIRHSQFEHRGEALYFRTHIGIQSAVLALFIGRIAYRFLFLYGAGQTASQAGGNNADQWQQFSRDPWTAVIFFILIAYYVGFYSYLIRESKNRIAPSS